MTNQHPVTPPLEKVEEWVAMLEYHRDEQVFSLAAQWGADQELEACVQLTRDNDGYDAALGLRATRRPKPPSLKEQALEALWQVGSCEGIDNDTFETLCRALEALPND